MPTIAKDQIMNKATITRGKECAQKKKPDLLRVPNIDVRDQANGILTVKGFELLNKKH